MKIYQFPTQKEWNDIVKRPIFEQEALIHRVQPILDRVKIDGDKALFELTAQFDGVSLANLAVTEEEFAHATAEVPDALKRAIQTAHANIQQFHAAQHTPPLEVETMPGVRCWRRSVAIERVGLYVPGGSAPLFSTVLMLGIPAQVAGCETVVLCTPPNKAGSVHPAILYAAALVGIRKVFKVGGAQAVGAMAYGTQSVPKVYKILGPGNQYVTAAKQLVAQQGVAIDMPAGPSEVAVVADATAHPHFVAADLLSQAEHGADSQVLLVTTSPELIPKVRAALEQQLAQLPRQHLAAAALANSSLVLVKDENDALALINEYAPEHLILAMERSEAFAERVINAGSVFLGHYTPESAGDYASGTNHTLPTNGFAKVYSGVSLDTFVKKITYQQISRDGLQRIGSTIMEMAAAEQLEAHRNAVKVRLEEK